MSQKRSIPRFASKTFRSQFSPRTSQASGHRVLLWPDTFNNYFHPRTALAAAEVLKACGFHVDLPPKNLCCGRPLYDFGFLARAKKQLREILDALAPDLERNTPIVVLEPSCASVFRDELLNLFPDDVRAKQLSASVVLLSELLARSDIDLPPLDRQAIVQGHCHHRAVMTMGAEEAILERLRLHYSLIDSGCCGMAGAFGFEPSHYDISQRIGERVLLPAARSAETGTLIIADGFSCREQIRQSTGREAVHLAEALLMAFRQRPKEPLSL